MVRFRPIWTGTRTPSTSTVVLALRYQPSDPVENSLTSASSCWLPIITVTCLALARNSARVIGQVVFLAMTIPQKVGSGKVGGPVASAAGGPPPGGVARGR